MPRATWNGFLRLSLVSCPVYLSPATTEAKRIRLNQLNDLTGNRLAQRLVDSETGEVVERAHLAKGYEYSRGRYVTITDDELKSLQTPSSKVIDLDHFVDRDAVDPVYLDTPYYVYPDGEMAAEAFRVIGEAMARENKVGIGRITISSRERMVLVEPRGAGLVMSTLRSADEVRAAEFGETHGEVDAEMVAIAETIITRKTGAFDPTTVRDRYQDALRKLVEAKVKGQPFEQRPAAEPPKVISLMEALKRSLAEATPPAEEAAKPRQQRGRAAGDRRQRALLLPVAGGQKGAPEKAAPVKPAKTAAVAPAASRRRRKA